jgi:hypothetical protein
MPHRDRARSGAEFERGRRRRQLLREPAHAPWLQRALARDRRGVWDDRGVLGVVARTNVADPDDIARTLLPELRGLSPAERARIEHYAAVEGRGFGRRFDTGRGEVAGATARLVGLGPGVQGPGWGGDWAAGMPPRRAQSLTPHAPNGTALHAFGRWVARAFASSAAGHGHAQSHPTNHPEAPTGRRLRSQLVVGRHAPIAVIARRGRAATPG